MSNDPRELPAHRTGPRRPRVHRDVPAALGVFVVVLLSMQVFLLTVGLLPSITAPMKWVKSVGSPILISASWLSISFSTAGQRDLAM